MSEGVLLVYLLDFSFIGLLPVVFFKRKDGLNPRWWITAWPFFACPLFLLAVYYGLIPPLFVDENPAQLLRELASVPIAVVSIALIAFTLGTHRTPIALWHQAGDAPQHIVTWGAYRRIRHPFYASFLLAFLGACVFLPHWGTGALFLYSVVVLTWTARGEERRLCESEFGAEYRAYMERTGRFFPRWKS